MIELVRAGLDVGLYTNQWERVAAFYRDQAGVPYGEMLPVGGGVRQHRLNLHGAILKVNDSRDPLPAGTSGYRSLVIAWDGVTEPVSHHDPDGLSVSVVPPGYDGIDTIAIGMAVSDIDAHHAFLTGALGAEQISERTYRFSSTVISIEHDPDFVRSGSTRALGFRYLTMQVADVDAAHAQLVAAGGREGSPPRTLGEVARISFVLDPDGNPIEVSQRASYAGSLK